MGKKRVATLENYSDMWFSHLGTRWELGLTNPYIYMLNQIIRLQVVLEIITNQTAEALELVAKQQ